MMVILLFEIADKTHHWWWFYLFFGLLGAIGFVLGRWKWWLGTAWLLLVLWAVVVHIYQSVVIFDVIVNELGFSWVLNSFTASIFGIVFNILGVFRGISKTPGEVSVISVEVKNADTKTS